MELGWLSPTGEFIEVNYFEHLRIAQEIVLKYYKINIDNVPDDFLMDRGWVHITINTTADHTIHIFYNKYLTESQRYFLKPYVEEFWQWIDNSEKFKLAQELNLSSY